MKTKIYGLKDFHAKLETEKENGVKLFNMVIKEIGSDNALRALVTHGSLLNLIIHSIDHQKKIRALANSTKSNMEATAAKEKAQAILCAWLDKNIERYKGRLDVCASDAERQLKRLGRGYDWIRLEITSYRKKQKS